MTKRTTKKIKDGGLAFPNPHYPSAKGMTLRDWFAGQAMQGDWASQSLEVGQFSSATDDGVYHERALAYLRAADAMIAARDTEAS